MSTEVLTLTAHNDRVLRIREAWNADARAKREERRRAGVLCPNCQTEMLYRFGPDPYELDHVTSKRVKCPQCGYKGKKKF